MLKLTITTPSTSSTLKAIEKQEFTIQLEQMATLKAMFPETDMGSGEQWKERFEMVYDMDVDNQVIKSKEDAIRQQQVDYEELVRTIDLAPATEG